MKNQHFRWIAFIAVLAVACSGKKSSDSQPADKAPANAQPDQAAKSPQAGEGQAAADKAPKPVADKDPKPADKAPALAPCPADDALQATLKGVLKPSAKQSIELIACKPARIGGPAWVVYAWLDTGDSEDPDDAELRRVVIDAKNAVIAEAKPEHAAPWYRAEGFDGDIEAADLDGDGTDEVIEKSVFSHSGETEMFVLVRRVDGKTLALVEPKLIIEFDNSAAVEDEKDAVECASELKISPADANHKRALVITPKEPEQSDKCGTGTFTFEAGKLKRAP